LAKEAGIDIGRVEGSGPHGRVIARDVAKAKEGGGLRAPATTPGAASGAAAPMIAPSMSDQQIRALYDDGSYEVVPHDGMRRTIAQRLTASVQTIPHFFLTVDCDIGKLLDAREEINAGAPKDKDGKPAYKLSVNDFVIKALALALQKVPDANVSWTEGGMLKHKASDIGVAVAMPNGLITPIIRDAETKSLSAISNEMRGLATRARERKLKPHDYQGGTTAVSNLGMYGIKDFTAVINPPRRRDERGTRGGASRQDRSRPHHERDHGLRPPRRRRRARCGIGRRLQGADREPGDDAGVRKARWGRRTPMNRFALFLIALLAWYLTAIFLSGFGPFALQDLKYVVPVALLIGSIYALPTLIVAAIADGFATIWFPKQPTLGFLLLILLGLAGLAICIRYGQGIQILDRTDNRNYFSDYSGSSFFVYPGRSTVAIVLVYTVANVVRELHKLRPDQDPSP
jgi:pyruvate dehydrogenase E2 component (dihydrolipoamide acetyltransferase)